ncbi:MAG: Gfo/Idh/MocA family oxidoreductase [Chloroflexia bacterium]|nr:Gfo/Idh/MocA family oxidoreductase [Chloroflexia bacterium]
MSGRTYRAAVIGCGKMSSGHADAYKTVAGVELIAGADVFEGARVAFAAKYSVDRMYSDAQEMLNTEKPDLVSICTWPPLHAELTEAAFAAGVKGVWSEKPMSVHLSEADRMVKAAVAAGGVLIVNHQRRYIDSYVQARSLIAEGAIGDLTLITGICGGDALTDGTHLIDMTRFLNNDVPVTSVFGAIDMTPKGDVSPDGMGTIEFNQTRMRYGHHVESGSSAIVFFENGVRGHLEMGNLAREGYQRFSIDGTGGRIELSGDRAFADGSRIRVQRHTGTIEFPSPSTVEGAMERALSDLLTTIETGAEHTLSGTSGRTDLEIVNAVYESARQRRIVPLPLEVRESPLEAMLTAGEIQLN